MIIALFIIIAFVVACLPIAAIVVVSVASRREDAAWSLCEPAQGTAQAAARRLLNFHTEDPAWPLPKNCGQVRPAAPALRPVPQVSIPRASVPQGSLPRARRSTVTDARGPVAPSKISVRTAA